MLQVQTHSIVGISLILILCSCNSGPSGPIGKSLEDPSAEFEHQTKMITAWVGYSKTPSEWHIIAAGQDQIMTGSRKPDLEEYDGEMIDVYDIQIKRRFDFDGGVPLQFTSGMKYHQFGSRTYYHRFRTHMNRFGRNSDAGIPSTAEAVDESGRLLGKATVKRYLKNTDGAGLGVEIEEIHMSSDGEPYFKALSHYRYFTGLKAYEKPEFGKKRKELFPVWPTSQ